MSTTGVFLIGSVVGAGCVLLVLVLFRVLRPWLKLKTSSGQGSILYIVGMRLRGNPPSLIIDAYLSLLHSGEQVNLREVESCYIVNRSRITDTHDLVDALHKRETT